MAPYKTPFNKQGWISIEFSFHLYLKLNNELNFPAMYYVLNCVEEEELSMCPTNLIVQTVCLPCFRNCHFQFGDSTTGIKTVIILLHFQTKMAYLSLKLTLLDWYAIVMLMWWGGGLSTI